MSLIKNTENLILKAVNELGYELDNVTLEKYSGAAAAAIPAIRPSIIAELASSIPDTSPATNTPESEVLP